jgi:SSS family solute:Na+ symporter
MLLLLGWLFAPFYLRSGVLTMPEFLERRYGPAARYFFSSVSIVVYVFTRIMLPIYAGGILLSSVAGWDMRTAAVAIVLAAGLYTVIGGLAAVIYTNLAQTFIVIASAIALALAGAGKPGGSEGMAASAPSAFWSTFEPMSDPNFPWTGLVFGALIFGIWCWCTDQYVVQRVLSARNLDHARGGALFAGFLMIVSAFILFLPWKVAHALTNGALSGVHADPLPAGLRGLVAAGVLAMFMSSLSATFNSTAALLAIDIFKRLKPAADERATVNFGRWATGAIVLIGLLWIPLIAASSSKSMYGYFVNVQAYVAPPIAACFLFGVLWNRLNGRGAIASLLAGLLLGGARFILEIRHRMSPLINDFLRYIATVDLLHYVIFMFAASSAVLVAVSLACEAPSRRKLTHLTFSEAGEILHEKTVWHSVNIAASVVLVVLLVILW